MYRCLVFMLRVQRMCSACAARVQRMCSASFWIGCGCKHHYIRILIRSHSHPYRKVMKSGWWLPHDEMWDEHDNSTYKPWLKMGWQLSGVWWTIMNQVASSWTVIFTSHFHHNYNWTTSTDSNVEYMCIGEEWEHGRKHGMYQHMMDSAFCHLPRHLLIPPEWPAPMPAPVVICDDANSKLIVLSHYSGRFRFSACFNSRHSMRSSVCFQAKSHFMPKTAFCFWITKTWVLD